MKGMAVFAFSPVILEAEAGVCCQEIGGQPAPHSLYQDSQSFIVRPYLRKQTKGKRAVNGAQCK